MATIKLYLNDILVINNISYLVVKGLDPKQKRKLQQSPDYENLEHEAELMTRGKCVNPGVFSIKNTDLTETNQQTPKRLLKK